MQRVSVAAFGILALLAVFLASPNLARTQDGSTIKIVNGALTSDYPTTGALVGVDGTLCSGTLIGCQTFLTAAHCVCDADLFFGNECQPGDPGAPDPSDFLVFLQHAGAFDASDIRVHPAFRENLAGTAFIADAALVSVSPPVSGITPAPLNRDTNPSSGTIGTIAGFGVGLFLDRGLKRFASVDTVSCGLTIDDDKSLCWSSGSLADPTTCSGDSGGPLFVDFGTGDVAAGIHSTADCVPPALAVDTSVFFYRDWIDLEGDGDVSTSSCGSLPPIGGMDTQIGAFSGILGSTVPEARHQFDVPLGTTALRVALNAAETLGNSFRLYVREGAPPSPSPAFECTRTPFWGQWAFCEFSSPAAATWHVLVDREAGSGAYQVTASMFGGGAVNLPPDLDSGDVSPAEGDLEANTTFSYSVEYADSDGSAARFVLLCVDTPVSTCRSVDPSDPSDTVYPMTTSDGVVYTADVSAAELGLGMHTYAFYGEDLFGAWGTEPLSGFKEGPEVRSSFEGPQIRFIEPDGVDDYVDRSTDPVYRISWSTNVACTVDLSLGTGPGNPETPIVSGLSHAPSFYDWDTSSTSAGSYRIKATCDDGLEVDAAWSPGAVTIGDSPQCLPSLQWEVPVVLASGAKPRIAVGPPGVVHALYRDSSLSALAYLRSDDAGYTWLPSPVVVSPALADAAVAADSTGNAHIVLEAPGTSRTEVYYARISPMAQLVQAPRLISVDDSTSSLEPWIFVDELDTIHVVWLEDSSIGGRDVPFYRRSTTGGVSWDNQRELLCDGAPNDVQSLTVAADGGGVYAMFVRDDGRTPDTDRVWLIRGSNYGGDWPACGNPPINVDTAPEREDTRAPRFAAQGQELLAAFHTRQGRVFATRSGDSGASWDNDTLVSDTVAFPLAAALESGLVGIVGRLPSPLGGAYLESNDRGATWCLEENLGTGVPADIAADPTQVYVIGTEQSTAEVYVQQSRDPLDPDHDKVSFADDNCLGVYNPTQTDGDIDGIGDACDSCPNDPMNDTDGDGVCEAVDNCPGVANPTQADIDGDGTGNECDADADDDLILDDGGGSGLRGDEPCTGGGTFACDDNCPLTSNPRQEDEDFDGIGDACDGCIDADGDGFGDPGVPTNACGVDNCPQTANPGQTDSDGDGVGDACDVRLTAVGLSAPSQARLGERGISLEATIRNVGDQVATNAEAVFFISADDGAIAPAIDAMVGSCAGGIVAPDQSVACLDSAASVPIDVVTLSIGESDFAYWGACAREVGREFAVDGEGNCEGVTARVALPEPPTSLLSVAAMITISVLGRATRKGRVARIRWK